MVVVVAVSLEAAMAVAVEEVAEMDLEELETEAEVPKEQAATVVVARALVS